MDTGDLLQAYLDAGLLKENTRTIALAGSGGKTSILYRLAEEYAARGERVAAATTTRMYKPEHFISDAAKIPLQPPRGSVFFFGKEASAEKIGPPDFLSLLPARFDRILLEADGAQRKPLKFPASHEPVLPEFTDALLVIAGLSSLQQPLEICCHRAALAAEILGTSGDVPVSSGDLATLLLEGYGDLLRKYPGGVILNQADTKAQKKEAARIAKALSGFLVLIQSLPSVYRK